MIMTHRIFTSLKLGDALYDKEMHDTLVVAAQRIITSREPAYVHMTSLWVSSMFGTDEAMNIAATIQCCFPKKCLHFWTHQDFPDLDELKNICNREARQIYNIHVEALKTNKIPSLFGLDGIADFDKLPQFFREGTLVEI